jgi:hypothetical protein
VIAAHLPDRPVRPLVKHGGMFTLGDPVRRTAAVVATRLLDGGVLRVAATGPTADPGTPWRIALIAPDGAVTGLGEHVGDGNGDLLVDLPARDLCPAGHRVRVHRDGAEPGHAVIAG